MCTVLAGDLEALGPEFVVTSDTAHTQKQPWLACDDQGRFVVSYSRGDVYARLLDRDGVPLTLDFLVNPTVNYGEQDETYVSVDPVTGDFVVVWSDRHGNDGWEMGIGGRFFAANGTPYGPEFILNTHTMYSQFEPHAAFSASGHVFVVWTDAGTDGSAGVIGRMFNRHGTALTTELLLNTPSTKTQIDPSVSCDRNGNFVVAFVDASGTTGEPREVLARLFDKNGVAKGPEFLVNSASVGMQRDPIVAMNTDGEFVVVFQDESGTDGSGWGVFARMFDKNGVAKGPQFVVPVATAGDQKDPHLSMDYAGNFIVSWEDASGPDSDVKARRFDRHGNFLSTDIAVHTPGKPGDQNYQKFAVSQSGQRFIAVWFDSNSDDYARLFELEKIAPSGPASVGATVNLALELPGCGGESYLLLAALTTDPGIPVTGQRNLALNLDPLLVYTLLVPNGPLFNGMAGFLDAAGAAAASFNVPNDPALKGIAVHFAAVTLAAGSVADVRQLTDTRTLSIQ